MKVLFRFKVLLIILLLANSSSAQDLRSSKTDWESFQAKMKSFANLENADFEEFRTGEKDDWKRAFVFKDSLDLFENTRFLYGYNNARQQYIECTINEFNERTGSKNLNKAKEDLQMIEGFLEEILDENYKKYDNASIRKECVYCSDSTVVLWKNTSEAGTKFLEKRYVTFEYYQGSSKVEITFYNGRREIDGFFDERKKEEKTQEQLLIDLKNNDALKETEAWEGNSETSERYRFIHNYLLLMNTEKSDSPKLKSKLSPSFIAAKKIGEVPFKVNGFSNYGGFRIAGHSDNEITVYIWGKNLNWTHKVSFKVVNENGVLYIKPSDLNKDYYVTPWISIERFVKVVFK